MAEDLERDPCLGARWDWVWAHTDPEVPAASPTELAYLLVCAAERGLAGGGSIDTAAAIGLLRDLEARHGLERLFGGYPALLDRYDTVIQAWKEAQS